MAVMSARERCPSRDRGKRWVRSVNRVRPFAIKIPTKVDSLLTDPEFVPAYLYFHCLTLYKTDITLRALSKSRSWPARRWPNQSYLQSNKLFQRDFAEKPSPSCILLRI